MDADEDRRYGDEDRQDALASTYEAGRLIHQLRTVEEEVSRLLESGARAAAERGVSQAIIAEALGLTPGRVSQIIISGESPAPGWSGRIQTIRQWPGDALAAITNYPGTMTLPPYPRRRTSRTNQGQ